MPTNNRIPSQEQLILEELAEHAGEWVPMPRLAAVSGAYAVHSRISGLREEGHPIECRVDRSTRPYRSSYRLLMPQEVEA
jgi:hypothetical protein